MHYTIKSGSSFANMDLLLTFDKIGNEYVISIWDKATHRTIRENRFKHYDDAETAFSAWCKEFDVRTLHEPEYDPADFNFD